MNAEAQVRITVIIPTKNEAKNIGRCMEVLNGWADEVVVVDSQSTDGTCEIAEKMGATVLQFQYEGGWPKKRQWVLNTYDIRNEWVLLLDADEILLDPIKCEIEDAIASKQYDGYWIKYQIYFMGRQLKYGGTQLWKLFLFRRGKGKYERLLDNQDTSMTDIEVHEHVIVNGNVGYLYNPVRHENVNSLDRYISKHNKYSNWASKVYMVDDVPGTLPPALFGNQAQRRRWMKSVFLNLPGFPIFLFLYKYIIQLGFIDGKQGLIYCCFQAIQFFHIKSKIFESKLTSKV